MKGYILTGGRGARLSPTKGLLTVGGRPIIERVRSAVAPLVDDLILVGTVTSGSLADLRTIIEDSPGAGPLAALCAALTDAHPDEALIVPCDTPFLTTGLLNYLQQCRNDADAAVPRRGNLVEPLCAVYGPGCLGPAKKALQAGEVRPVSFYRAVTIRWVTSEELSSFGEWERLFLNVNTWDDLELARRLSDSDER